MTTDALEIMKKFENKGFHTDQAQAFTEIIIEILEQKKYVSTKADVMIAAFGAEADIIKWLFLLFIAQTGVFIAIIKFIG